MWPTFVASNAVVSCRALSPIHACLFAPCTWRSVHATPPCASLPRSYTLPVYMRHWSQQLEVRNGCIWAALFSHGRGSRRGAWLRCAAGPASCIPVWCLFLTSGVGDVVLFCYFKRVVPRHSAWGKYWRTSVSEFCPLCVC